jgi:hypothetical protein
MVYGKINVFVLVCVPGKFKQIDDQLKEHSPSLCTMSDSQWDQDSWWVATQSCIIWTELRLPETYAEFFLSYSLYHFPNYSVR